jgi:hypothetical protein
VHIPVPGKKLWHSPLADLQSQGIEANALSQDVGFDDDSTGNFREFVLEFVNPLHYQPNP